MKATATRYAVHALFMQRAIELARRGWYTTRPNPRVGCVIVRDERIIGEGWHERAGEAHAETRALEDVTRQGHSTRCATAYVTLEPCSHTGLTPPCADALIDAGIACVVVGADDPNPAVDGRGLARLREAGVDVVTDVASTRCMELNPGFNSRMQRGRPRVRLKLAMSLDGRIAAADGQSQWITGEPAREDGHRLRAESGAVMVGSATLAADDPSLNVRLDGDWPQPLRVVLDSRLTMTPDARMLSLDGDTCVFTTSDDAGRIEALEAAGARVKRVAAGTGGVDLEQMLRALAQQQINDVLIEAGPTLAGALTEAGLVDEYVIYMAPKLLGDGGRGLLHLPDVHGLADAIGLTIVDVEPVGADWRIVAQPARARGA